MLFRSLIKNEFYQQIEKAEARGASKEEIAELLGKGRAKKGIFEGDIKEGELEIGQIASHIKDLPTVDNVFETLITEYNKTITTLTTTH